MEDLETEVDSLRINAQGYARPVNFKQGVNIRDLKQGVDFEISDRLEDGYDSEPQFPGEALERGESYFDEEELFRNINFERTREPGESSYHCYAVFACLLATRLNLPWPDLVRTRYTRINSHFVLSL